MSDDKQYDLSLISKWAGEPNSAAGDIIGNKTAEKLAEEFYQNRPDEREKFLTLCQKHLQTPPRALIGLEELPIISLETAAYLRIRKLLLNSSVSIEEKNQNAYKALLLFGTDQQLRRFAKKNHVLDKDADLNLSIRKIHFPDFTHWPTVNFRAWGRTFIYNEINILLVSKFRTLSPFTDPVHRNEFVSPTMEQFKLTVRAHSAMSEKILSDIVSLSQKFKLTANEYVRAVSVYSTRNSQTVDSCPIPPLVIDGKRFNMPGCQFVKLNRDDPRALFIGNFTECCERIVDAQNNIENTIAHAYKTNESAFYVVMRDNVIIAHSWAWRGKAGELVLDGFETSRNSNFDRYKLNILLDEILKELEQDSFANYTINGLYVGKCSEKLSPLFGKEDAISVSTIKPNAMSGLGMNHNYGILHKVLSL